MIPRARVKKIVKSKRGIAAITAAITLAAAGGWYSLQDTSSKVLPPAVILATDKLILPWEGMVLKSHWDRYAKIYDICAGITRINGKPIQPGMQFTRTECEALTKKQIYEDYYTPLVNKVPGYTKFPVGVQAAILSGAYNFGLGSFSPRRGMLGSTAMRYYMAGNYRAGCEAQTAWNKAGGIVVEGLVKRREMGDAQRLGEAEVCVSGL